MRRRNDMDAMVHLALYDRPLRTGETRTMFLRHVLASRTEEKMQDSSECMLKLVELMFIAHNGEPLATIGGPEAKALLEEYARDAYTDTTGQKPPKDFTAWPACLKYDEKRSYPEAVMTEVGWELGVLLAEEGQRGSN